MRYAVLFSALLSASALGQTTVGIASGQPTGTNYPMVQDIVRVCSTPQSKINNIISDGSLDNINKVYGDKTSQYGIAQVDAAVYQQGIDPKMMDRILMVFPFFSTEMHAIVRADSKINSLADLQGKRVIEGPDGSGTWVSVQVIKATTKLSWTSMLAGQQEGLNMVLNGQADAEFIVAGKPISMLEKASNVRLIPLSHPALDSFKYYTKAMIPSGTYPFQKTAINTYKVDNMLITYAFKNQYQAEINLLVTCIARNIDTLQRTGHPKWKDVDPLDIERISWPSHPAAVIAIKKEAKRK